MNQSEMISNFNKTHREPFTEQLFMRDDMEFVEELKKVILSSQRDSFFKIRVEKFTVIDNYEEINQLLYEYDELYKNKNKNRRKENQYSFINLKDSDIRLLIITYYIEIGDEHDTIDVYIAVPRIVDKYYLRINGNMYSTMFQIVDGSTYNNLTSNSKYSSVTLKTMFMPIRIYKYSEVLKPLNDDKSVKCTYYVTRIFNKSLPGIKYFFAKFGFYDAIGFLGLRDIFVTKEEIEDENMYTFKLSNGNFLSVPKMLMDNDNMTQSVIYIIIRSVMKDTVYEDIFGTDFWKISLGQEFNNFTVEKGESILVSLESIYDIATKESIRLPEDEKTDIYCILRWMLREFQALRMKDNLDISYKKIRLAEYAASLYAMKLSRGIYRVSDLQKRANILSIKKALTIHPTYLLSALDKCNLVNYRNMVNDMDSITALKCTYKGISGLGENGANAIPDIYRAINPSHIKRVDLDSSSATDPGITGTLCPYVDLYNGGFFSDYFEPNSWESEFELTIKEYNAAVGLKEVATFKSKVLGSDNEDELRETSEVVAAMEKLITPAFFVDIQTQYDNIIYLEEGGKITYERGIDCCQL